MNHRRTQIGRREFVFGSLAALGGAAIPACGCQGAPPPKPPTTTKRPRPTTTTSKPTTTTRPITTTTTAPPTPPSPGVRTIGEQYLADHPGTGRAALESSLPAGVNRASGADAQLGQAAQAIADDLAQERMERVDGWWFSRTEVHICALGVLRAG